MRNCISIPETKAWAIRSTVAGKERFFLTDNLWEATPLNATIFKTEEIAERMIAVHLERFTRLHNEIIEPVPLYGALKQNGITINLRKNKKG